MRLFSSQVQRHHLGPLPRRGVAGAGLRGLDGEAGVPPQAGAGAGGGGSVGGASGVGLGLGGGSGEVGGGGPVQPSEQRVHALYAAIERLRVKREGKVQAPVETLDGHRLLGPLLVGPPWHAVAEKPTGASTASPTPTSSRRSFSRLARNGREWSGTRGSSPQLPFCVSLIET